MLTPEIWLLEGLVPKKYVLVSVIFSLLPIEIVGDGMMPSPSKQLETLKSFGFTVVRNKLVEQINVENLLQTLIEFKRLVSLR